MPKLIQIDGVPPLTNHIRRMPQYRIFSVDKLPIQLGDFQADNDNEAIRALVAAGEDACELWCGGRFVSEHPPFAASLRTII